MVLNDGQRAYQNPGSGYSDAGDPPADNLETWEVISDWTVFNKWLVTTNNQPLNNKSSSQFFKHPSMTYNRSGNNWMGVVPEWWTMKNDGEE